MSKSAKARAEALFSPTPKKEDHDLQEKERAQRDKADHVANLRAQRLAKEAADKKVAEHTAAGKLTAKNK